MILLAKFLAKLLKTLNSEVSHNQIAAGFGFGALIGLVPVQGLLPILLLIISFLININLAMAALATAIFKLVSYAVDPIANQIGYYFLVNVPSLKPFWTKLANMPIIPYTKFNNTVVLGSLIVGLLIQLPVFFVARWAVIRYRTSFREKFQKLKIVQMFQATALYRYYESYRSLRGE